MTIDKRLSNRNSPDLVKFFNQKRFNLENVFNFLQSKGVNTNSVIIAGGYFTNSVFVGIHGYSYLQNQFQTDIDVFIINDDFSYTKIRKEFEDSKRDISIDGYDFEIQIRSNNIIDIKNVCDNFNSIQIINKSQIKTHKNLIEDFDLSISKIGISKNEVFYSGSSLQDIRSKKVKVHRFKSPMAIMRRLTKYSSRGFNCSEQINQVFKKIGQNKDAREIINQYISLQANGNSYYQDEFQIQKDNDILIRMKQLQKKSNIIIVNDYISSMGLNYMEW